MTGQPVELLETHISWILLSGSLAYKLKKPVRFADVMDTVKQLLRIT